MHTIAVETTATPKLERSSPMRQQGFATTAKVLVVAVSVTGVGLVATLRYEPRPEATSKSAVEVAGPVDARLGDIARDGELREWLREPQPPTF